MQSKLRQSAALHESAQQEQFNEVAYEKERLEKCNEDSGREQVCQASHTVKVGNPQANLGHDGRAQHCPISKTSTSSHS